MFSCCVVLVNCGVPVVVGVVLMRVGFWCVGLSLFVLCLLWCVLYCCECVVFEFVLLCVVVWLFRLVYVCCGCCVVVLLCSFGCVVW